MKTTAVQRQAADPVKEPFVAYLVVSAAAHAILVVCMLVGLWFWSVPTYYKPSSYTVSLVDAPVSLRQPVPSGGKETPVPKQEKSKPPVEKQEAPPSRPPKTTPAVTAPQAKEKKPAPAPKRSQTVQAEKKTQKKTPPVSSTKQRASSRQPVRKRRQAQTHQRRSASKAEQAKQQRAAVERLAALRERFDSGVVAGTANEAAAGLQEVRLRAYQELVREQVIEAWILPLPQEEVQKLQATALLTVDRDGHVTRLELLQASGNPLFDDSLLRAIKQAEPLPVLPEDYGGKILEVELRFRAGGL